TPPSASPTTLMKIVRVSPGAIVKSHDPQSLLPKIPIDAPDVARGRTRARAVAATNHDFIAHLAISERESRGEQSKAASVPLAYRSPIQGVHRGPRSEADSLARTSIENFDPRPQRDCGPDRAANVGVDEQRAPADTRRRYVGTSSGTLRLDRNTIY